MKAIFAAALRSKFDSKNIYSLLEVVQATPNPELAMNILLGTYEEVSVPVTGPTEVYPNEQEKTLVSYDKWQNRVQYTYQVIGDDGVVKERTSYMDLDRWLRK